MLQLDCGYTPAEIREMTLEDVSRFAAFQRKHPPLRVLFAALHGFKPVEEPSSDPKKFMSLDDMRRLMAGTGGKIAAIARTQS